MGNRGSRSGYFVFLGQILLQWRVLCGGIHGIVWCVCQQIEWGLGLQEETNPRQTFEEQSLQLFVLLQAI